MTLYEIRNGWTGEAYVRCLVIADSEARALELARVQYEREYAGRKYHSDPCANLVCEVVCADTSAEWAGEVTDA